jgi:hypothetical protein
VEEIVMPEIESLKPIVAKRVLEEMKAAGVRGSKQDLQTMHSERTVKIVRRMISVSFMNLISSSSQQSGRSSLSNTIALHYHPS